MKIDHHYRVVNLPKNSVYKERLYCFCKVDSLNKDVYDLEPRLNVMQDRVSVLWTEKTLKEFRPNIGIFEYTKMVFKETIQTDINTLKRIIRSPTYSTSCKSDVIWIKKAKDKLEALKSYNIIFVQINFID